MTYETGMRAGTEVEGPDARYITGQAIHVNGAGYLP